MTTAPQGTANRHQAAIIPASALHVIGNDRLDYRRRTRLVNAGHERVPTHGNTTQSRHHRSRLPSFPVTVYHYRDPRVGRDRRHDLIRTMTDNHHNTFQAKHISVVAMMGLIRRDAQEFRDHI